MDSSGRYDTDTEEEYDTDTSYQEETDTERVPFRSAELVKSDDPPPWRGYERLQLIRDLAMGELSPKELARNYGVQDIDIRYFAEDFREEINEVRLALQGTLSIETAGLWITKKQNRLAEYQQEAEEIRSFLQALRDKGFHWSRAHRDLLRSYLEILRATAEELGAYPQRSAPPQRAGTAVRYVIEVEDEEDLQ